MDKRCAHYDLVRVKKAISDKGYLAFTKTARESIRSMGLTLDTALRVVAGLRDDGAIVISFKRLEP